MIIYRKKVSENKETYCRISTDVLNGPTDKGFVLTIPPEIPFLATHTYKIFETALLLPYFEEGNYDYGPIITCQDGWESIDENEYTKILNQIIESMK